MTRMDKNKKMGLEPGRAGWQQGLALVLLAQ